MVLKPLLLVLVFAIQDTTQSSWHGRPSVFHKPQFARYIISNANWGVVSAYSEIYGQPFGTLQSFADGPAIEQSSGTPYFYISQWSTTYKNIEANSTVSLTVSEAESDYCEAHHLDPMEPICGRIMLTGALVPVAGSVELDFAKDALFTRHPAMKLWPTKHHWTFMKLNLTSVNVLSFYGGISHVSLEDYFKAKPTP